MPLSIPVMAKDSSQELSSSGFEWYRSSQPYQHTVSTCRLAETALLDETIEVVKEKVWSFRNAWRGVAEVLCGIGVSPTILGYSSVPHHEEGYVNEQDEGVLALQEVDEGEISRKSCPGPLNTGSSQGAIPEEENFLETEEEEEDVDHGFAESARKELVERKSLTRSAT